MGRHGGGPAEGKWLSHAGTSGFGLGAQSPRQPFATPAQPQPPPPTHTTDPAWLRPSRLVPMGVALFVVVAVISAGLASGWNAPGYRASGNFLNFYTGVFALVSLSISVMIGLSATDRLVMAPRHRVLAQAVHRAAAFTAVSMMVVHAACKLGDGHIGLVDTAVPFLAQRRPAVVGLGVVAAYLMIVVCVSGIIRGRFAAGHRPWVWRTVHALAYAAWPAAIVHGLLSGRSAASWVTLSYVLCVLMVVLALPTRLVTRARAGRRS